MQTNEKSEVTDELDPKTDLGSQMDLSEKPIDFIWLKSSKFLGNPLFLILISLSIISLIWFKNQGSIFDKL